MGRPGWVDSQTLHPEAVDGFFDVALMPWVLEHLERPARALRPTYRALNRPHFEPACLVERLRELSQLRQACVHIVAVYERR
jgi:hypothetical protein